ncbi:MAG: radical SAM protein [Bacilli bacterium]|nr:radical SAM protein [Bacilli bacterium]
MLSYSLTCLGPGKRVGLWVRGCKRNCPGCISPTFQKYDSQYDVEVGELLSKIIGKSPSDLRITISGGEPFDQKDLLPLLKCLRENGFYDILVYTGYRFEELYADPQKRECLSYIDVLIDGPYIQELNDNHALRGSSNQRIIFLNEGLAEEYKPQIEGERKFQLEQVENGTFNFYGIPPKGLDFKTINEDLK